MDKNNKIKYGSKDEFYCFKVCGDKKLNYMISKLEELKCIITKNDYKKREINIKDDFREFLDKENNIFKKNIVDDLNSTLKKKYPEIAVSSLEGIDINCYDKQKNDDNNFKTICKIGIECDYASFIDEKFILLCNILNNSSTYLGKSVDLFMTSFLCQPIKIRYNSKEHLINVKISVYSTGNLIVQYTIPIEDVEFKYISNNLNNKMESVLFLPLYMVGNSGTYDYDKEEYTLEEALNKYNNYILRCFKGYSKLNVPTFINYTLVDYDGIPETFNDMNLDLSRDIYWILYGPFGYINEKEKDEYKNLYKNRYIINNYSSLFVSSNPTSVVLYNKLQFKEDSLKEWFNNKNKYESAIIYILPSIEMILIKKSYYYLISYEKFDERYSIRKLRRKYFDIVKINDYLFHIRYGGFGSVTRLQEFLERNLIDYLPVKFLEKNLNNYKEMLEIVEATNRDKNIFLVATIAMLFPIIFGLNAIETMNKSLDIYLKTNLSKYSLKLWIAVIIFIGLFLSVNILKKIVYRTIRIFIKIRNSIKNYFQKLKEN